MQPSSSGADDRLSVPARPKQRNSAATTADNDGSANENNENTESSEREPGGRGGSENEGDAEEEDGVHQCARCT